MNLGHNLGYAVRQWARNPGFTAIAALTVALGVGPNVAIFSAIWGIFLAPLPFGAVLFGAFALLALSLAALGIYGVMAFAVAQRGHEVGLRMALGAQKEEVLRLVLKEGLTLGLYGTAIGLVGVYALGRLMRSTLYGVHTVDMLSLGIVVVVLFTAAFFACYIPARRAAKVDPMVALRYE